MTATITLILGGARSGKSSFAERLALQSGRSVAFVATATPEDDEMATRIAAHQRGRPRDWRTVEAPLQIASAIRSQVRPGELALIDCLTLWVSNVILDHVGQSPSDESLAQTDWSRIENNLLTEIREIANHARRNNVTLIVVSNEVGLGVVPAYTLGRHYQDALGRVNQAMAGLADTVALMIAGIPIDVRQLALPGFSSK